MVTVHSRKFQSKQWFAGFTKDRFMSLKQLEAVVPPPDHPRNVTDVAGWKRAEAIIGSELPSDFREFTFRYGEGTFNDPGRLCIFTRNPLLPGFEAQFQHDCELLESMKSHNDPDDFPYDVFPSSPGLLLWASDDNGCKFCWLTEGHPDSWPVLVSPPRHTYWERFPITMTCFLAQAFSRKLKCVPWADEVFFSGPRRVKFAQEGEIEYQ
jgi:hypothetical protein